MIDSSKFPFPSPLTRTARMKILSSYSKQLSGSSRAPHFKFFSSSHRVSSQLDIIFPSKPEPQHIEWNASSKPSPLTSENVPQGLGCPNGPTQSSRSIKNLSASAELGEEQEPSELGKMRRVKVWQMIVSKTSNPLQLGSLGNSRPELKHRLMGVKKVLQSLVHSSRHSVMLSCGCL